MTSPVRSADVAAAFVSFNCSEVLLQNVSLILRQVDLAVVVDNGSGPASAPILAAIEALPSTLVIRLGANLGIAKALNVAVETMAARGYRWVLTMDQDSRPGDNLVDELVEDANAGANGRPVALVAPLIFGEPDRALIQGWKPPAVGDARQTAWPTVVCFTSGALTSVETWKRVGGFNEPFFIDYVDNEYCLRCQDHGAVVLQSFTAAIYHSWGQRQVHSFMGRKMSATHHSPLRRYFITRNRIQVWRTFWKRHRDYVTTDMQNMLLESMKILAFESHKVSKFASIFRGVRDALTRRPNLDR